MNKTEVSLELLNSVRLTCALWRSVVTCYKIPNKVLMNFQSQFLMSFTAFPTIMAFVTSPLRYPLASAGNSSHAW